MQFVRPHLCEDHEYSLLSPYHFYTVEHNISLGIITV